MNNRRGDILTMKKLLTYSALMLPLVACSPTAEELADAIAAGDAGSVTYVNTDLGLKVNVQYTAEYTESLLEQHFRVVEGAEAVEQVGTDATKKGDKVTVEASAGGSQTLHIIGKTTDRGLPWDNDSIVYNRVGYLVEARDVASVDSEKTTIIAGSLTIENLVESTTRDRVGQFVLSGDAIGDIDADYISGDTIQPFNGHIGRMNPRNGEFWIGNTMFGDAIFRVLGTEALTIAVNGKDTNVTAVKVEVREAVQGPVQADLIEACFETTKAGDATNIDALDCPPVIIASTEWWYRNMLVKAERSVVFVSPDGDWLEVDGSTGTTKFDQGYGFELFQNCDHDQDAGATTAEVACRFFSDNDQDPAVQLYTAGGPSVDFSANAATKYFHYVQETWNQSWAVTAIDDKEVEEIGGAAAAE